MVIEGDKVAFRWTMAGTHQGMWLGRPASVKPVKFMGMNMERFENGKIVEHWSNPDVLTALMQIGAIPTPGQAGR